MPSDCRVVNQTAVSEHDDPRAVGRRLGVMRHHHDGLALLVQIFEQEKYILARVGVEVSRGLVGKEHGRVRDERSRNCHALHFAARKLFGPVLDAFRKPHFFQERFGLRLDLGEGDAFEQERQARVLGCREDGQEVEELEDEADLSAADEREFIVRDAVERSVVDEDFSGCGLVEPADEVQERTLSRAARTHYGKKFAGLDTE